MKTFSNNKHCGMVDIGQWSIESSTRIGKDGEASNPAILVIHGTSL
jgi:hypothetical protein